MTALKVRPERPQGQVTKVEVKDRRPPEGPKVRPKRPMGQVAKVEVTVKLDLLPPKEKAKDPPAPSRPVPSGNYPCTYEGCTAIPFQTQYLLNSHMNVHSDTRTHFCPMEGCPRGPGGQGFKRKNEMIR